MLRFEIEATAFCHQMVRSIVGTVVAVGRAEVHAGDIRGILRSGQRSAAGSHRPARGPLPLARVLLRLRSIQLVGYSCGSSRSRTAMSFSTSGLGSGVSTANCSVPFDPPYPATSSGSSGSTDPLCGK